MATVTNFEEAKQQLQTPMPGFKPDDDSLAIELTPALKDVLAYFHGEWKVYEEGCWSRRDVYEMRRYIRKELRNFRGRGVSVNQSRIKSLAAMMEDELFIPDRAVMEKQDERKQYINLRNGLFNLETFEIEPHRPELYFTTQLGFDYNEEADCPVFRKYLNTSLVYPDGQPDPSLVMLATEALAYSLTARTDMKASFWLVGAKDSGKSTFISMIKALMGDLHTTIDLTQLGINRFLLSSIVGKRVVTFTEASSSTMLPDALYKAVTGGSDEIYADVKNRDPIVFRPEAKVWWAMNEMPRIQDRSGATTRRITIIPFNRSVPQHLRILNLEQQLMAERSGIFNQLITHLKRVTRAGKFDTCEQSELLMQEYIMENDTEATFLDECCQQHESYKIRGGELYQAYSAWCLQNGFKTKNSNQIAKEWRRLGFQYSRSAGSWWHGLKLHDAKIIGSEI